MVASSLPFEDTLIFLTKSIRNQYQLDFEICQKFVDLDLEMKYFRANGTSGFRILRGTLNWRNRVVGLHKTSRRMMPNFEPCFRRRGHSCEACMK